MIRICNASSRYRHVHHFGKDTARPPDIDGLAVILIKYNDLRRPIPPRADVIGELALLASDLWPFHSLILGYVCPMRRQRFRVFD